MATYLGGKLDLSVQTEVGGAGVVIPAVFVQEASVEVTEGTRTVTTLGGTFSTPSGMSESSMITVTMVLDSMERLKDIFGDLYNAPTTPQLSGNFIIGSATCGSRDGGWLNLHYTCDSDDNNDVHFYNAVAQLNFAPTYNNGDALTVEVVFMATPNDAGNILRIGTGNLTAISEWDATTGATVPVV